MITNWQLTLFDSDHEQIQDTLSLGDTAHPMFSPAATVSTAGTEETEKNGGIHQLGTGQWAPWVAVSGGFALLLSTYSPTASVPLIHLQTTDAYGITRSASVQPNTSPGNSVIGFLRDIDASCEREGFVPCTGPNSESHVFSLTFEVVEDESQLVPRQVLCKTGISGTSVHTACLASENPTPRFLSQLVHATQQLVAAAGEPRRGSHGENNITATLRDLDLVCHEDRCELGRLNAWLPPPLHSTVHTLISQQSLTSPGALAVHAWDGDFSYSELEVLSSRLSLQMLSAGVRGGETVPLCFEKSVWSIVAILAVLKAGCAFLLVDASYPISRLKLLVNEAGAKTVLCSAAQEERVGRASLPTRVMVVSDQTVRGNPMVEGTQHSLRVNDEVSPSAVAAVIFTSGTTGTPKAIALEHSSLCSSLVPLAKHARLGPTTRFFQFSSYAFDASFGEILMTLLSGGCICVPSDADRLDNLADAVRALNANTALFTASVLRLLKSADVSGLKTVISGGERVTSDLIDIWGAGREFFIIYGPAECTVAVIAKQCANRKGKDSSDRRGLSCLGTPVNCRAWIMRRDDPNKVAPLGAIGELVVEGPTVGRGYMNSSSGPSPFLDAPPPWSGEWESFGGDSGWGRSYRTGDLARWTSDGEIVFEGRRDRQIKLHGQRIELEEIERHLQQLVGPDGGVIFVHVLELAGATGSLVGFLCIGGADNTAEKIETLRKAEEIRAQASSKLPSYMLPQIWVPLAEVPFTRAGKLDRRELARIGTEYHANTFKLAQTAAVSTQSPKQAELALADAWNRILQLSGAWSPDAHFFQLGGDSLRALQLGAALRTEGYCLTVDKVFRNPAFSSMVAAMEVVPSSARSVFPTPRTQQQSDAEIPTCLSDPGPSQGRVLSELACTSLQEGLFSVSQALPSLYTTRFVFDLSPTIDIQRLKDAFVNISNAYPILRTAIVISSNSRFTQVVLTNRVNWTEADDLSSYLALDARVPFAPGQYLARHCLVKDPSTEKCYVVWTLHHAIFDGWSMQHMVSHLLGNYHSGGVVSDPDKKLAGAFESFIGFCENENKAESRSFWEEQLRDAPASTFPKLPDHTTANRRLRSTDSCLQFTMTVPKASLTGATYTTTVMARAAWALLLSAYEGSDDIVFGNTLHGRNSLPPELQNTVGPTLSTLPIRVRIDSQQSVLSFLNGLQKQFSAMVPHEQFGLARILTIDRTFGSTNNIFHTLLIVQGLDISSVCDGHIRIREAERQNYEYPLVIALEPRKSRQIELGATFDSTILSASQVRRILSQFQHIYCQLQSVADNKMKVGDLNLASPADMAAMYRWNARYHRTFEVCVHDMVQEHVKRSPNAPAVHSTDKIMSYAELDDMSNKVARELVIHLGVEQGDVVGMLFDRSPWAPVCMLALAKVGAAFAPLPPTDPPARLARIVSAAGITAVLCSPSQLSRFEQPPWKTTFAVDEAAISKLSPWDSASHRAAIGISVSPSDTLYVLSTSGTTGTPKLFAIQNKKFATGAIARAPLIHRTRSSRVLQFAPLNFDPSVEDILTTLMFGGCVCMPSAADILSGNLASFMRHARVNFANLTPSMAHTLDPAVIPDLRVLLLSGEAPDSALIKKWADRKDCTLMNGYGPSECSVKCAINCELDAGDPKNIGHAVGASLWLVDANNNPTPLGAVGELVIESPNLAGRYLGQPEETAKRFVLSPEWLKNFRNGHEETVYRTGDLARFREDGNLVYIGRVDSQLKLHGQRFEATEVQQSIEEYLTTEKEEAGEWKVIVDIARFQGQTSDVLVAFLARSRQQYSGHNGEVQHDVALQTYWAGATKQMARRLSRVLPAYMVPSVFLAINAIPVTANGKVDRRALQALAARLRPGPELLRQLDYLESSMPGVIAPVSDAEHLLHRLWRDILGLSSDRFGVTAHFFELGGSSMTAIRLAATVRAEGYILSAPVIFQHPILSEMALHLIPMGSKDGSHLNEASVDPQRFSSLAHAGCTIDEVRESLSRHNIPHGNLEDVYLCTRQQMLIFREEDASPGGWVFRHIVPLPENVDLDRLETALRRVADVNAFLRTRVLKVGSRLVQVVLKNDFACRRFSSLSELAAADRECSWGVDALPSRWALVGNGSKNHEERYLAWTANHGMWDGWVRKLLWADIDHVYHFDALPKPRPSFSRFIQHILQQGKIQQNQDVISMPVREFVTENRCSFFPPLDGMRDPSLTRFFTMRIDFPTALPKNLSYATTMMAAWAMVSTHVEQYPHYLWNVLLSGRDAPLPGIDELMGPTTATAPLAFYVDNDMTARQFVETMQVRVGEANNMQHCIDFGPALNELLEGAPNFAVHPAEDYVESPTKHLNLLRSRVDVVGATASRFWMNFILRTDNEGVDLFLGVDPFYFPEDKATRYFRLFKHVVLRMFSQGGLDKKVKDINWNCAEEMTNEALGIKVLGLADRAECFSHDA